MGQRWANYIHNMTTLAQRWCNVELATVSQRWPNGKNYVAPTLAIYVGLTVLFMLGQRSCAIWVGPCPNLQPIPTGHNDILVHFSFELKPKMNAR